MTAFTTATASTQTARKTTIDLKGRVFMNNRDFEAMNQKLIDGYIDRQRNNTYMLDDDSYPDARKYRISWDEKWVGRRQYKAFYRRDVLEYAGCDLRMTEISKFDLINFNIIGMKFERMTAEHCCMMNGTFRNVRFFRFCIRGYMIFPFGEIEENEYHRHRSIVMNCRFENCVFMNSYAQHTDWINCEFINCTFVNSNLCCEGSEFQNCRSEGEVTVYVRG